MLNSCAQSMEHFYGEHSMTSQVQGPLIGPCRPHCISLGLGSPMTRSVECRFWKGGALGYIGLTKSYHPLFLFHTFLAVHRAASCLLTFPGVYSLVYIPCVHLLCILPCVLMSLGDLHLVKQVHADTPVHRASSLPGLARTW